MGYYNPEIHHRRSIHLKDYDYSQAGAYFITICTYRRAEMFGEITNDGLHINERGEIVQAMWNTLSHRFPGIELDHFIAMPNHLHGIIVRTQQITPEIENNGDKVVRLSNQAIISNLDIYRKSRYRPQMLHEMVRTFKAVASYHLRRGGKTPDFRWQREYYEHIIRTPQELDIIRAYILNNPFRWQQDKLHPLSNWYPKQNQPRHS